MIHIEYLLQHPSLQRLFSVLPPGQDFPPHVGPLQDLDLIDDPPPHVLLHVDQDVHDAQIPSTATKDFILQVIYMIIYLRQH